MIYDLIIVGGGPSAITAGIYAARKKINTLLIAKELGGQVNGAHIIDNYPGLPETPGIDLVEKLVQHLQKFEIKINKDEIVEDIKLLESDSDIKNFEVKTNKDVYQTKSIIIAMGNLPRKLYIPGAEEFAGKGISYCATCDAPLFADKNVAVIGAGDAGMDTAWQLTQYAKKIYIINKYAELKSDDVILQEKIEKHPLIEIISSAEIKEIQGGKFVEKLIYAQNGENKEIKIDGIFVEIGWIANTEFVQKVVKLNEKKEIIIDSQTNTTSIDGIFAAGDVTNIPHKQIIIAAGEGAKATLNVYKYLRTHNV